jgi:Rod binding domain-containing protein
MSSDFSSSSITPILSPDLLSGGVSAAGMKGATQEAKIKAACKAIEGIFAGQLLSEIGKGLGGAEESQQSGLYQDFIQQALAQQVTSGNGFGLAAMLEKSLTPAHHPATGTTGGTTPTTPHAHGTSS